MKTRFLVLVLCLSSLVLLVASCGYHPRQSAAPGSATPARRADFVVDDTGTAIPRLKKCERIVSLAPSCTEILFALGLGDKVVAVSESSDYPPEALKKPKLKGLHINYEQVMALQPDLVVADYILQPKAVQQLRKLGLKVVALNPGTLEDVVADIAMVGLVTGRKAEAERLSERMLAVFAAAKRQAKPTGLKVFVEISMKPLYAAAPDTFIGNMLKLCGAENVVPAKYKGFTALSEEVLLVGDPDLIITFSQDAPALLKQAKYRELKAVRAGKIVPLDPNLFLRPGPRLAEGVKVLFELVQGRPLQVPAAGPEGESAKQKTS